MRRRLDRLRDEVNSHHERAGESAKCWLEHVRQAGIALQEAYERTGRRRKWSMWLGTTNLGRNCMRTARVYRQIAREWGKVQAAMNSGTQITSIRAALRVITHPPVAEVADLTSHRKYIRKSIVEFLRTLSENETEVLSKNFGIFSKTLRSSIQDAINSGNGNRSDFAFSSPTWHESRKTMNQRLASGDWGHD